MSISTSELLGRLKSRLLGRELTAEDFYESEEVADVGADVMFDYFLGKLSEQDFARVEELAEQSQLFLADLIKVGEIVAVDQTELKDSPLSWLDLTSIDSNAPGDLPSTKLASTHDMQLELSSVHVLAASSESVELKGSLPFGLDYEVFEFEKNLSIDFTARDSALAGQLIGYCVRGESGAYAGVVLMRAGESGLVSASANLERSQLAGKYSLDIVPVESSDLSQADFDRITLAISRDSDDPAAMAAWRAWIELISASDDGRGLSKLLVPLKQRFFPA